MTTTNILQIPGFSQIPYRIFSLPPTNAKTAPGPATLANDLRRAQIALLRNAQLASIKNGELWTFSQDGLQSAPAPEESSGLQEISTGTLFASQLLIMTETPAQGATTQTIRNGPAYENFLSAVRALLEFTFLQKPGYRILGDWLIPPSTDDQGQDGFRLLLPCIYTPSPCRGMFKLNVNLAANGELYIVPERNASTPLQPVSSVQPPAEGTLLFLSPSGTRAEFISILPSTSQTSAVLQKIRMTTGLEAQFPLIRVRLTSSGVDTLWPVNLSFQQCTSRNINSLDTVDYFNLKDGVSSAIKLISDVLTYKPPPAPSPAILSSVAAHVTPSGAYHTPPDGLTRTKPVTITAQTPTINQSAQEDWIASTKDDDDVWPSVSNARDEDETFVFEEGFDLQEEDFDFFDDEPSGEIDETLDNLVSELRPQEDRRTAVELEPKAQPMEEVRLEKPSSPPQEHESQMVLSPPHSPLRILPSPPPSKRGSFPRVWDHVRLSGNLERLQEKYRRGGKYWCDDLNENARDDDSMSESSSEDEGIDVMTINPRKRKRDGHDDEKNLSAPVNGATTGIQNVDSDSISAMTRAIDDNFLLLQNSRDDFIKSMPKTNEKKGSYMNNLDPDEFAALAETVASQAAWDGLGSINNETDQHTISIDDFKSVISDIWGVDAANNPSLKELTEVTDVMPSDEEDSPQMKTPRMKPVRSSHSQSSSTLSLYNIEQTQSIYPIPAPSFLVHRIVNRVPPTPNHTQRLSIGRPALRFWEKFSFSPVAGEKDVQCYAVHPDSDGMASAAETFLSEIQTAWESCGMGKFERGKVSESGKDGMIAISIPPNAEEETYLAACQDALVNFGRGLSKLPNNWLKNILVLMIDPFSNGSAVIPLCRAFLGFKTAYFAGVDNPATVPTSHVALQIVPVKMIASKEGILMRGLEFSSFMRRLYGLCEVMEATTTTNPKPTSRSRDFLTSPATHIAAPPPAIIEFTDSFPFQYHNLLKDNSSLHLAYSVSSDNRWVAAVWTDDWGLVSLKESYCLARPTTAVLGSKYQQVQTFENICALIWRRTLDIVKQTRISWKLIIVRTGGMSKSEIGIWKFLNQTDPPESPTRIQLLLACIDLNPALALSVLNTGTVVASPLATISTPFPSSTAAFSHASPAGIGNAYGTPVATPLAAANESPDPSGGIMSTPGGTVTNVDNVSEFDPDVRWVDASDEVWAVVLSHRVPACPATDADQEIRFSLASGFLWPVKSNVPYNLVQVHLLYTDKPQSESVPNPDTFPNTYARLILKQLLSEYRGLSSLGVIRGVKCPEKIVPWHVYAAERIKDVFTEYM